MAPWQFWMWPWIVPANGGGVRHGGTKAAVAETGDGCAIPWATPNRCLLETEQFRLWDFSVAAGKPVLIVTPFTLHDAGLADLAHGHSLVESLLASGCRALMLLEWKSANLERRFETVDMQLAAMNVAVDEIGGVVDLVGLCQGGWLSLLYTARFRRKVSRLVLAGVPVDVEAAPSAVTIAAQSTPAFTVDHLIESGGGLVDGATMLRLWPDEPEWPVLARDALQIAPLTSARSAEKAISAFLGWFGRTLDLPGTYYRQALHWLYLENRLALGRFPALGRDVDLASITCPLALLAAGDDNIAPREQVFAAASLVGTPADAQIRLEAEGNHLALFMGRKTLRREWRRIAHWLGDAGVGSREAKAPPRGRKPRPRSR